VDCTAGKGPRPGSSSHPQGGRLLLPSDCATANSSPVASKSSSKEKVSGTSCSISGKRAKFPADESLPSPTMPNTTMREFTCPGGWAWQASSSFISCRPTARNSIPLNGSGSSPDALASTIATLRAWKKSSRPWRPGSSNGKGPTLSCAAAGRTMI